MVNSLNETVELMTSSDYKDRFKAEYYQLEYRYNKLKKMMDDWDSGLCHLHQHALMIVMKPKWFI